LGPARVSDALVASVTASGYRIPTESIESDGTFVWDSTTLVLVEVEAGDALGIGYTYGAAAAVALVSRRIRPA
jgi:hypothetical protein